MLKSKFFEAKFQIFLWVIAVVSIGLNAYLITTIATSYNDKNIEYSESELPPPPLETKIQAIKHNWVLGNDGMISIDVNKTDKLIILLTSANIKPDKFERILASIKQSGQIDEIKAGSRIQIQINEMSKKEGMIDPKALTIFLDNHKLETTFNVASNSFETKKIKLPLEWQVKVVSGTINGSLFSSAKKAGAEPTVVTQLINLFSYDIDFQRDIRAGDTFRIMYEYQTDYRGKIVKNPKILYANINHAGVPKELYRHVSTANSIEYYNKKGHSIKRSLLKTPINGAKITSNYGYRTHPVLGYSKMHQGLDYGAPKGTPVLAAGDGVVQYAKNLSRGYGKHIQIKHNDSYSTLYGHLSRFANNVNFGSKVKQGQVIGYVGSTGMATGPHLHYEVIHNGKKINPAKIKIPTFHPLNGKELAKFKDNTRKLDQMVAELDDKKTSNVAYYNANIKK